jgi:hypothetical protein
VKIHTLSNSYELDISALLGCHSAHVRSYLPTFIDDLSIPPKRDNQPFFLDCLIVEGGADRFSRNVGK